jgi:hypothetical protein
MPIATSRDRKTDYILKEDRGRDNPTVFLIGVLTYRQKREIESLAMGALDLGSLKLGEMGKAGAQDKLLSDAKVSPNFLKLSRDAMELRVRAGVKGWKDFHFEDGKPVSCLIEGDKLSDASFEAVAPWIEELSEAVDAATTVTRDDVKN